MFGREKRFVIKHLQILTDVEGPTEYQYPTTRDLYNTGEWPSNEMHALKMRLKERYSASVSQKNSKGTGIDRISKCRLRVVLLSLSSSSDTRKKPARKTMAARDPGGEKHLFPPQAFAHSRVIINK